MWTCPRDAFGVPHLRVWPDPLRPVAPAVACLIRVLKQPPGRVHPSVRSDECISHFNSLRPHDRFHNGRSGFAWSSRKIIEGQTINDVKRVR
jgi:hypothetical protein